MFECGTYNKSAWRTWPGFGCCPTCGNYPKSEARLAYPTQRTPINRKCLCESIVYKCVCVCVCLHVCANRLLWLLHQPHRFPAIPFTLPLSIFENSQFRMCIYSGERKYIYICKSVCACVYIGGGRVCLCTCCVLLICLTWHFVVDKNRAKSLHKITFAICTRNLIDTAEPWVPELLFIRRWRWRRQQTSI